VSPGSPSDSPSFLLSPPGGSGRRWPGCRRTGARGFRAITDRDSSRGSLPKRWSRAETLVQMGVGHTRIRDPAAYANRQRGDRAVPADGRREDRRARPGGRPPGEGRCGGDPGGVQPPAALLVVVVLAASGLLSWTSGGVTGRAPPEVPRGQRTAKAGELETATAPDPLAQARNRLLRKTPGCLTF